MTVILAGTFNSVATTSEDGEYAFNDLRAGDYSVEIRGIDPASPARRSAI